MKLNSQPNTTPLGALLQVVNGEENKNKRNLGRRQKFGEDVRGGFLRVVSRVAGCFPFVEGGLLGCVDYIVDG